MAIKYNIKLAEEAQLVAEEIEAQGVHHIDFIYSWYEDEWQVINSQAFDASDELMNAEFSLHTLIRGLEGELYDPLHLHNFDEIPLYLYSPSAHRIIVSGQVDGQIDEYTLKDEGREPNDYDDLWTHIPQFSPNYEDLLAALTWQPDIDEALLREYVQHDAVEVRVAIASNPNIPEDIAYTLAEDVAVDVRKALAQLPALPLELQRKLSQDSDKEVRTALVSSRYTSSQILVDICKNLSQSEIDDDVILTRLATSNPNIPVDFLVKKYQSGDLAQAINLAKHPDLSFDALSAMLDQEYDIESVWYHPYSLWSLLIDYHYQKLSFAQLIEVHKRVFTIFVTHPDKCEASKVWSLQRKIAWALRTKTTPDYKDNIAKLVENYPLSKETSILYSIIVRDSSLSWSFICELGLDKIRLSRDLASRKDIPRAFWENLWEQYAEPTEGEEDWLADARWHVKHKLFYKEEKKSIEERFADLRTCFTAKECIYEEWFDLESLITEESCPPEILEACAKDILTQSNGDDVMEVLQYLTAALVDKAAAPHAALAQHSHYRIRKTVAASQRTPEDVLAQLSEDEAWQVRMEIARNRFTPRAILEKFANDEHPAVQQALLQNLAAPRHLLQRLPEH